MTDAPLMLGVSGLRGIVGKSLTREVAIRFAGTFGSWLRMKSGSPQPRVVIGRDGRAYGDIIHHAVISGLLGVGCDVTDLGIVPTPTVGAMMDYHRAAGGMVVTASHNPQEWNGLKCLVRPEPELGDPSTAASAPTAKDAAEIVDWFQAGRVQLAEGGRLGRVELQADAIDQHSLNVWQGIETLRGTMWDFPSFRVVLDSVNASGAPAGRRLLEGSLGCKLTHLNASESGRFPHVPEPILENLGELCRIVPAAAADIGFAQDPDADRLAIVDETGRYIGEEYTLVLAALALLGVPSTEHGLPPPAVIFTNLSTSRMIEDVASAHGARVVRTPVGEANVVAAMKQCVSERLSAMPEVTPGKAHPQDIRRRYTANSYVFGGEGNGGVIWPKVTYVRDSLSAMALVLSLMARTGKKVSELVAAIPAYAIEKRKVELAHKEDARPAVEKIAAAYRDQKIDLQDGVRVDWLEKKAWLHVRASNTEPIMRLIAEAPTAAESRAILDDAARVIAG